MRKILILSDSHHERELLMRIVENNPDCEAYFHCGDSQLPSHDQSLQAFYVVAGNTDFDSQLAPELLLDFSPYTFWLTHGHRYRVNWELTQLVQTAKNLQAQVVCFGHTHVPTCQKIDGILCVNPGSVVSPRGGWSFGTYIILEFSVENPEIIVRFYKSASHELVDEQIVCMA